MAQPQDDAALADDAPHHGDRTVWPGQSGKARPQEEAEQDPPISTAELRKSYPDLALRETPAFTVTAGTGTLYPFQTISAGLGVDLYVLPRLRVNAFLSGGLAPSLNGWNNSLYADAGVGVAFVRWHGETTVDLPVVAARFRRQDPSDGPFIHANVPTTHSFELEGGILTGYYQLARCKADCDLPWHLNQPYDDESEQLKLPYAGLRYTYFRWAKSELAPFRSSSHFAAAVDVLMSPFELADTALFKLSGGHPTRGRVGARVNLRIPVRCKILWPCWAVSVTGGYLPSPGDGLASAQLEVF